MQHASSSKRIAAGNLRRRAARVMDTRAAVIVGFLLLPAVIYTALVIYPVIQAVYLSLYRWNGLGPLQDFNGLQNYSRILSDSIFLRALSHNLTLVILSIGIQLPLALALALLVGRHLPGRTLFRVIFFLPFVLSEPIAGVIWSFIYRPEAGLLNTALQSLLPNLRAIPWLANPDTVLLAVFAALSWKFFGLHMVLYIAGLQNIPRELEEAARIDGASNLQVLRHITVPLLGSTIRLTIYLSVLGSLQTFGLVWIMTTGGPVNASETMATYLYKYAFQRFALGYGSAVAVVMFIICFGFSLIYQRYVMRRDFE